VLQDTEAVALDLVEQGHVDTAHDDAAALGVAVLVGQRSERPVVILAGPVGLGLEQGAHMLRRGRMAELAGAHAVVLEVGGGDVDAAASGVLAHVAHDVR